MTRRPSPRRGPLRLRRSLPFIFPVFALLMGVAATPDTSLQAQDRSWCDTEWSNREQICEVRDLTVGVRNGSFSIDAGPNGTVRVEEWEGSNVRISARVSASGRTLRAAQDAFDQIELITSEGRFESSGPRRLQNGSWSVSVRVEVPRGTALTLGTVNGSITVTGVSGAVDARTTNGSITVRDANGRADLRTVNGAIRAHFAGPLPRDGDIRVRTTNGTVELTLPRDLSARLEASTTNGGITTDFPITVQGRIGRRISATLGDGGALIEARTTNGGIRLREG